MENTSQTTSQTSQEKPTGNTKSVGPQNQLYRWFFTLDYEELTASQLSQNLKGFCKAFTFSGEIGKGGYKHWQGVFSLKNKEYFGTVKNLFPNTIHLEACKNWWAATQYCKKEETHIEGPYDEKYEFLNLPSKLFKWQQKVVDICLTVPNDRTINWFWDDKGCKGKTVLCKYLACTMGASIISNGCLKDIAYTLDNPKIVCFNFTRSNEDHINYGAIEAVKDGLIFSSKYESRMKIFNSPHVFIFANFCPNRRFLSEDRWNIEEILG